MQTQTASQGRTILVPAPNALAESFTGGPDAPSPEGVPDERRHEKPAGKTSGVDSTHVRRGKLLQEAKERTISPQARDGGRRQPILVLYVLVARTREEPEQECFVCARPDAGGCWYKSKLHEGKDLCTRCYERREESVCKRAGR